MLNIIYCILEKIICNLEKSNRIRVLIFSIFSYMFTVRKRVEVRVMFRMNWGIEDTSTSIVPQELLPVMSVIIGWKNWWDKHVMRRLAYINSHIEVVMQLARDTKINWIPVITTLESAYTPQNSWYSLTPEMTGRIQQFLKIIFPPKDH